MAATHEERLAHFLAANPLTDDHQKERRPSFNSLDRCASAGDGGGSALTLGEQLKKIALLAAPDPAMDGVLAAEKAWAAAAAARAGEWSPARLQRLVRGKLLGGGGFASVWACTVHGEPLSKEGSEEGGGGAEETVYALKALHKGRILALHAAPRVALEKEALGALSFHPYVTTLHATFQDASTLYFIMERATGGDMFSLLERRGKVPEPHARHYVACVGLALRALHDRGLVYRDLKPENVLLDSAGHPLLADMGFAQQVSPHGRTHSRCGSEEYAPPELLDGRGRAPAADLWCLGVLAFELVVGRPPFMASTPSQTLEKIRAHAVGGAAAAAELRERLCAVPGGVTEAGAAGICGLLDPDESRRLGCSVYGGFAEMMHHGWFAEVYHRKGITCPAVDWPALARKEVPPPFVPPEDLRPVEPPADDVLNPHAYGLPGEGGDTWAPQFDKFGPTLDVPGVRIDWNPKQGKRLRRKTAEF